MDKATIEQRLNALEATGKAVLATKRQDRAYGSVIYINGGLMHGFRAGVLSFLSSVFGAEHSYVKEFETHTRNDLGSSIDSGLAILAQVRDEIQAGWALSYRSLVAADICGDFLDMADALLEAGFKDAAAVMIGSVLEEHLRTLCRRRGIDLQFINGAGRAVAKKAEAMNVDLHKASAYNMQDQKSVTSWLDLRNNAAHGHYAEYKKEQVDLMRAGVALFISRVPT
ncbi:hypothetical protein ACO2Q9_19090 [Variovorax sp. VNK109]|uniref:hypothetical protein n=1 Tax=Variovorax sp. VNK109 TaxID=3400919 RepID=UPI003C08F2F5